MCKIVNILLLLLLSMGAMAKERVELVPFGELDTWVVRYIDESKLLGGKTKIIYAPGLTDTIRVNAPYVYGQNGCPWTTSNAYAKVGVEKASVSAVPERRDNGYCARLDAKMEEVKCLGIDISVMVAGTLFTGKTLEPVNMKGGNDPYSVISMGYPYTEHPMALMVDYKAHIEDSDSITVAKVLKRKRTMPGRDCAEIIVFLQHRWEDADGNIYARRVGTAYERITTDTPEWQNDHRIPVRWGDITMQKGYQDYEGLTGHAFRAQNAKGKMVPIQEIGYGLEAPTHAIIFFTSSRYEAFSGHEGNTLWIDNVRWVYDE